MATIDIYSKAQMDAKLPPTTGASSGDVLTFDGTNTDWAAGGGGGGGSLTDTQIIELFIGGINGQQPNSAMIYDPTILMPTDTGYTDKYNSSTNPFSYSVTFLGKTISGTFRTSTIQVISGQGCEMLTLIISATVGNTTINTTKVMIAGYQHD